jgi:hypothetical protein
VLPALEPWFTDTLDGEADSEKSSNGGGSTQALSAFENSS